MTVHPSSCSLYNRQLLDAAGDAIEEGKPPNWPRAFFHLEEQDTTLPGWATLRQLIEDAAKDGRELFSPRGILGRDFWSQIITLPESIRTLKRVKVLDLYGSPLLRIPPEIGQMESLEEFDPYTSYGLHWFPYEITQCKQLRKSRVSTRALYGNYKFRPSFPALDPVVPQLVSRQCSVCGMDLAGHQVQQRWLSLRVATDVLPLLVNACSETCVGRLPAGMAGYIELPHTGGPKIRQPVEPTNLRKIYIPAASDQVGSPLAANGSGRMEGLSELPPLKAKVPEWKAEELRKMREAQPAPAAGRINLSIRGLGLVIYSPWATADIPPGSDFLSTHYWEPDDVARLVNASAISCVGTGSPGDYIINVTVGSDAVLPKDACFPIRLGLEVRDETLCIRDLYDFHLWKPVCPATQKLALPNGFYRITAYTKEPASGVLGDGQEIHFHFELIPAKAKLAHLGVPQLC